MLMLDFIPQADCFFSCPLSPFYTLLHYTNVHDARILRNADWIICHYLMIVTGYLGTLQLNGLNIQLYLTMYRSNLAEN